MGVRTPGTTAEEIGEKTCVCPINLHKNEYSKQPWPRGIARKPGLSVCGSPGPANRLPVPALPTCHLLCLGWSPRLGREEFPWLVRKKRTLETLDKGDHCSSPLDFNSVLREASKADGWVCFQTLEPNLPQTDGEGEMCLLCS